jgi:hypothetical protein
MQGSTDTKPFVYKELERLPEKISVPISQKIKDAFAELDDKNKLKAKNLQLILLSVATSKAPYLMDNIFPLVKQIVIHPQFVSAVLLPLNMVPGDIYKVEQVPKQIEEARDAAYWMVLKYVAYN